MFVSSYTTSRVIYINFCSIYPICRLCGDENEFLFLLIDGENESWSVLAQSMLQFLLMEIQQTNLWGLRQENSLSSFLFFITVEVLNSLLMACIDKVRVGNNDEFKLTHMQFVNDMRLEGKSWVNIRALKVQFLK